MAKPKFELIGSGSSARPLPRKLAKVVKPLLASVGLSYINSGLRTQQAVSWARGKGAVLSSQAELYSGYIRGVPGYNPANPPGYSTHERRSDGVAYPQWTRGMPIPWWACGMDLDEGYIPALLASARARGWTATVTYPGNPSEGHHINFRKAPKLPLRPLKKGSKGIRVKKLTKRLKYLGVFQHRPRRKFDGSVEKAVREFQKKNHLKPDGVVGPNTQRQIMVNFRQKWSKEHK